MHRLVLSLFGSFQATLDGQPIAGFESARVRALLAYLAVECARPHTRQALMGLLWPDWPETSALTNLRNALAILRKAIGDRAATAPLLRVERDMLQFQPGEEGWVDAMAFQSLTAPGQPAEQLKEGVNLYRGSFLEGFSLKDSPPFEDWLLAQRESFQRRCLDALAKLAAQYEQEDQPGLALEAAWKQVDLAPWQEETQRGLMRLLALNGQRSAALAQYETCRHLLQKELGVEPSAETVKLYERIRAGEIAAPVPEAAPGQAQPNGAAILPTQASLPAYLTPFIGRRKLLDEIQTRLLDLACRLLTLTGPGGSGKTRLAAQSAAELAATFSDGVYFISLAALQSVESILPALIQSLGITAREGQPRKNLLDFLGQKRLLLVLDNFEHLLPGAELLGEILQAAPHVQLLVTSRVGLNLPGETLLPVPGMSVPDDLPQDLAELNQYSSVRLFLEEARRLSPGFSPDRVGLEQVLRICRLVGGLPLGILLAAGWLRLLSPAEIADEIAAHSLDFLEGDWQGVPERQRSLRAVCDYSWSLLSPREREVFAGLAVFRGGFTYPAAQQVAGAALRDLLKLANHSLLERSPDGRYALHELLRQYAQEKLEGLPDAGQGLRGRQAAYYLGELERLTAEFKGPRQVEALAGLDLEIDNIRAAWDWAVQHGQMELLARGMEGLGWYYHWRFRHADGEEAFRQAAEAQVEQRPDAPYIGDYFRAFKGSFLSWLGQKDRGDPLMETSLERLQAAAAAGQDVRRYLADVAWLNQKSIQPLEQSLALYRDLKDDWGAAKALYNLGRFAQTTGDYAAAPGYYRESLTIRRSLGTQLEIAETMQWLSGVLALIGHLEESGQVAQECLALCRRLGDPALLAGALHSLAAYSIIAGRYADAFAPLAECIALSEKHGDHILNIRAYLRLSRAESALGRYAAAQVALEHSYQLCQAFNPGFTGNTAWYLGELALARGAWGDAQRLLAEGVNFGSRSGYGISIAESGLAALRLGLFEQAYELLSQALQITVSIQGFYTSLCLVPIAGVFLGESGQPERAVELFALAQSHPFIANSALWQDIAGKPIAALAAGLPPAVAAAAEQRGRQRDLRATVAELAAEFGAKS